MKILVCDDKQDLCDEITSNVREATGEKPAELVGALLTEELTKFFDNVRSCLNIDNLAYCEPLPATPFDGSIVILDNNLTFLKIPGPPLTAESIAGYLRAFTRADYLISLNLNSEVDFDLRYLVGDYSTRADLALNTSHLANRALWTGKPSEAKDGFLPWYWPRLNTVVARRRKQIEFVNTNLTKPVLEILDFKSERIAQLSATAIGALSPNAESEGTTNEDLRPEKINVSDVFLARDRSLPVRSEREMIFKGIKNEFMREVMARTVAADIDFWFRRHIVAPQEPLVDLPHLVSRLPFLLGKNARNADGWNRCLSTREAPFGLDAQLYKQHLAPTLYSHDVWVPDPCFWWHELKKDEKLDELFFSAEEGDWADVVFCEDKSTFVQRKSDHEPTEFPAEFEGSWGQRYVAQVSPYRYAPRSRLAL